MSEGDFSLLDGDAGLPPQTDARRRWPLSATVRSEVALDASPLRVWEVLVDFAAYSEWNPFTPRVATTLEEGASVHLEVHGLAKKPLERVEYMHSIVPERRVCWTMSMGGLLAANRSQWLIPLKGGGTLYRTDDALSGVLTPLVMSLYGSAMQRGFDGVCRGLSEKLGVLA